MTERDASGKFVKAGEGASKAGGAFTKAAGAAKAFGSGLDSLKGSTGGVVGGFSTAANSASHFVSSISDAGGVTEMVTGALKSLGPEGEAVAIALQAIVTVATALVQVLWDLSAAAISISQEKDALAETFKALGPAGSDGYALVDSLSAVAAALPFAEGKVLAWGKSLMAAGLQGKALEDSINAVAAATAVMGDAGGAAAEKVFKALASDGAAADKMMKAIQTGGPKAAKLLAEMGLHVDELAEALGVTPEKLKTMKLTADQLGDAMKKALQEKGADALANLGLTWSSITGKLHDAWEDLFEDMGGAIKPFMGEVKALFAEFSAGGTAQGLTKSLLMAFFKELFAIATVTVHAIHKGFLMLEIAALKVAIAFAPFINALRKIAANEKVVTGFKIALLGVAVVLGIIAAAVLAVVIGVGIFVGLFALAVGAVVAGVSYVLGAIYDFASGVGDSLSGLGDTATTAAGDFVSGLVSGIQAGGSAVISAVSALAGSAVDAFKASLGIASPSKVMMQMGGHMAAGVAVGVDQGTPEVVASTRAMGDAAAGAGSSGGGSKGSGGGVTINGGVTLNVGNAGMGASAWAEEAFAAFMERLSTTQGLTEATT